MIDLLAPFNKMVIIGSTCLTCGSTRLTRILKLFFFFSTLKIKSKLSLVCQINFTIIRNLSHNNEKKTKKSNKKEGERREGERITSSSCSTKSFWFPTFGDY
jgi:hypothetical protein